ncbi:MAG: hypothetical protein ACRDHZ_18190 [Ktedonobacteraceae bacterium]
MRTEASVSANGDKYQPAKKSSLWNEHDVGAQEGLLGWWYKRVAPEEPQNSTPQDRERVRAGRLSSIMLLIMLLFGIEQLPNALTSTNPAFLPILLIAIVFVLGAFVFNRLGYVTAVGIALVIIVETAFILVMITAKPMTAGSLTNFYLIVVTELIAVSLLTPKSVFLVTFCNAVFTVLTLLFKPHTADLILATPANYYSDIGGPIALQVIVAIVTYLWVQGARLAIERAERVAALEGALAERDREVAEQKQQLELGIQQILQTHIQVANGDFSVRAPLARENVLWQVAHNLNNMLSRLQRAIQFENELQRTEGEAARVVDAVRRAKVTRRPIQLQKSGTLLDPLAQELTGNSLNQP